MNESIRAAEEDGVAGIEAEGVVVGEEAVARDFLIVVSYVIGGRTPGPDGTMKNYEPELHGVHAVRTECYGIRRSCTAAHYGTSPTRMAYTKCWRPFFS